MGTSAQGPDLWKQIDDAEHYLVSGLFERAISTTLSVSDQIHSTAVENSCDHDELLEMLELVGMVLVQAIKELKRTSEMFVQLKTVYGSVASIPLKIFITGAMMQMAEGSGSDLRPIFEEYLSKWRYTDDQVYVLNEVKNSSSNGVVVTSVMEPEQYFEVAELYTITLLSVVSRETEIAISWTGKAELTEQHRQDLLKKLHALPSETNKRSTNLWVKQSESAERNLSTLMNGSTSPAHEDAPKSLAHEDAPKSSTPAYNGSVHAVKRALPQSIHPSLQRVKNQFDPLFWWFHSFRIKFGKIHVVLPSGKVTFLLLLLFSTVYILRRKGARSKRYGFLTLGIGLFVLNVCVPL
ncbi:hypothetical protein GUJ93_ZPchr0006g40599 [Zizania palustris]|uniref:Uncharacterized protein n=1 Tax=Zizania palustris TaxID=103762 RepID=A0A8J5SS96_ZIZPA|nr:hypothetical protein GUJ93_ZPchr0006g40599 [Zizania palustris]